MSTRALALAAGAALGLALSSAAVLLVLASDHEDNKAATIALAVTAGLSFIVSGLIALWRRPENRTGYLLAAVGYLWFFGALSESNSDWLFTAGAVLGSLAFGAFVHLLLAFPSGRLTGRRDLWLVVTTYALVLMGNVATVLLEEVPNPTNCPDCRSTIAVGSNDVLETVLTVLATVAALALLATVLVIVVTRYLRSRGALRRALGPVLGAGAFAMLVLALQVVLDAYSEGAGQPLEYVFLAAFATVPLAFLMGVLRSRLSRVAVADLLVALGRGVPLRDALAQALRDPTLDVVYWIPARDCFVWHDGNEFHDDGGPRTARYVERNGQRIGAFLHDPSLSNESELIDAVAEAAGLWLDNDRLQAELRAQYDFLETIVDTAPSLLMSLDPAGRIVNFNAACERASGFENPEELRLQPFWDVFISTEEREEVVRRFASDPTHAAATWENTFVNRRGDEMVIAWSTAPLLDEDGNVRNVICGGLDVTERKRRELELDRERNFLRDVADATPSLLVVVNKEATVVGNSVNKSFEHTIGWTEHEMLGRSFLDLLRPEDAEVGRLGIASALRGTDPEEHVTQWRTREGGERIIAWTATPIVDITGTELVLVCGVDVTEREHREADLRASEERLRAAIEASPVAIVEYALDDTITRWNAAAERIFGWTAEQVVGGKAKHQPPGREAELRELFSRVRAGEVYTGVESTRVRSDGSLVDVAIAAAPIRDSTGSVVSHMALFADITQRKRHEEELLASRARIVAAGDEARRQLERNLHDGAQQRLVALSLSLRLAQSKVSSDPVAAEAVLESARDELAAALDELRELARGIHPAVLTDRGLAAAVETLAARSPVPIEFETPEEELPSAVEAAAYYVIAEALANVIKYAGATGVKVRVACENGSALVAVSDDGVGGADPTGGSGLSGLSDRVAALGGTLAVDSPAGGGTCVTAVIPLNTDPTV